MKRVVSLYFIGSVLTTVPAQQKIFSAQVKEDPAVTVSLNVVQSPMDNGDSCSHTAKAIEAPVRVTPGTLRVERKEPGIFCTKMGRLVYHFTKPLALDTLVDIKHGDGKKGYCNIDTTANISETELQKVINQWIKEKGSLQSQCEQAARNRSTCRKTGGQVENAAAYNSEIELLLAERNGVKLEKARASLPIRLKCAMNISGCNPLGGICR